jgi:hypothetical protein
VGALAGFVGIAGLGLALEKVGLALLGVRQSVVASRIRAPCGGKYCALMTPEYGRIARAIHEPPEARSDWFGPVAVVVK